MCLHVLYCFYRMGRPKPLILRLAHSRFSIHIVMKDEGKEGRKEERKGQGKEMGGGKVSAGSVGRP